MKHSSCFMSSRLLRVICMGLCYVLLLAPLVNSMPTARAQNLAATKRQQIESVGQQAGYLGSARSFLASLFAMFQGGAGPPAVPGTGLPDLDAARQGEATEPFAPAPIVSTQACTDCTPCPTCGPGNTNHAPVVGVAGPYSGTSGTAIVFNGMRSFDLDSGDGINDYSWSFGDNTAVVHGAMPSHTYQAAGNYNVTLTVTDRHSSSSSATTTAAISAPPATVPPSGSGGGNHAQFISQSVPTTMTAGQQYSVSVTMRNTGTTTWSAAHLYRLGSLNIMDNGTWGRNRIHLPQTVVPGADVTFNFVVTAPYSGVDEPPPTANFQWGMLQDGVQWFVDGMTTNQVITIISNYHPPNGGAISLGPIEDLFQARIAPQNRTGRDGEDLLSGNYHWSTSLLDLTGRAGLDLSLALSYNSLATWTKTENWNGAVAYSFDADRGSPAPGFRLGFPSIQGPFFNNQAHTAAYLMISPSGARTELRQVGVSNVYESVDSSSLQLLDGGNGSMLLRADDGMQMSYWSINNEYRCTEIKDRNGNFITIRYDAINGTANLGRITAIIDTLGREIDFNYDANFRLQSITQMRNGQAHAWVTFGYDSFRVQTNFEYPCGPTDAISSDGSCEHIPEQGLPANRTVEVLTQVGLDDGSRYLFDYTTWGQVYKIRHRAADSHDLSYTAYDLPLDDQRAQAECPRFTQRQDWVEDWNNNEPVETTFQVNHDESWGQVTVAPGTPDQTSYREYSTLEYTDWTRGLVTLSEIRDHTGTVKKTTATAWVRDITGLPYALNPRPKRVTIFDVEGNRRQTSFEYNSFGLLSEVFEQGPLNAGEWAILRRTHTDYDLSPAYVNRHIFGLVQGQYLFAPDAPNSPSVQTLMSKTTFEYDVDTGVCTGLCATYAAAAANSTITQHDGANYGAAFVVGRGALSRVRQWDVGDELNSAKSQASPMHYDALGSLISTSDALDHRTTVGYSDQFSADGSSTANPAVITLAYPTIVTDPDGFSASAKYEYSLGLRTRTQDPKGAAQIKQYDSAGRIKRVTNAVNGAYARWTYPDSMTILTQFTTIKDLTTEAFSARVFDGAGRVRASVSDFPDTTPHYSAQYTSYDVRGLAVLQSNPIEITGSWTATGADAPPNGFGWIFTAQSYDWKGRPLVTTNSNGGTVEASYGGCGCAGGGVLTLKDEGTMIDGVLRRRQRRISSDPLGRSVRTELMKWDGSVDATTTRTLNVRDQITLIREYEGTSENGVYRQTTMSYDGFGRLATRHAPQQQADPTNSASTDQTRWEYNLDDTIQKVTDGRGATATYEYNNRRLVKKVTFGAPAAIAVPAAITLAYDEVGNRTIMGDESGATTYQYDTMSQLTSEAHQFNGLAGNYMLAYEYNPGGELKKITNQNAGLSVNYAFDPVGRLTGVTGNGYGNVTQFALNTKYRASGALRHEDYGNNTGINLSYDKLLQITRYDLGGVKSLGTNQELPEGSDFQYYSDGRVKFAGDLHSTALTSGIQDRAFTYDNAGRIARAVSGTEARDLRDGTNSNSSDGPFKQIYTYDAWNNLQGRSGRYWTQDDNVTASYNSYSRNDAWTYDADGRLLSMNETSPNGFPFQSPQHGYDAAGNHVGVTQSFSQVLTAQGLFTTSTTRSQKYDGNGQEVKRVDTTQTTSLAPATKTTYYLRSAALSGQVIGHLDDQGVMKGSYVFARGTVLAQVGHNAGGTVGVLWEHPNPVTGDVIMSGATGGWSGATHLDTQGVDVGDADPFPSGGDNLFSPTEEGAGKLAPIGHIGGHSRCVLDGIETLCAFVSSEAAAQCEDNNCGVRWNPNINNGRGSYGAFEFFHSFANGYGGWMTAYGFSHYEGGRDFYNSPYDDDQEIKSRLNRTPGNLFSHSPQKVDSWARTVDKAFDRVRGIFKNNPNSDCAKYFGVNASKVLERMRQTPPTVRPKTDTPGATATGIQQAYGQGSTIGPGYRLPATFTVFQNGPFFTGGKGTIGTYPAGMYAAQNLAILHELAHNILVKGKPLIPNDGNDASLSVENTAEVRKHCNQEVFDAK